MTVDRNKGIPTGGILYNHLNLPVGVAVTANNGNNGIISYIYDATGAKLRKNVLTNGVNTPTDYADNYIYENGILKQFSHGEGYVEPKGNGWQYVYRYADMWGNTRITYADDNDDGTIDASSEIRREQNYYPFGLEHKGYNTVLNGVKNNLKTYQGQEFTEDLGLNTHEWRYRLSDPATGRFWQVDPLAEDYTYNSTYGFQENKLGIGIELEGAEVFTWDDIEALGKTAGNFVKNTYSSVGQSVQDIGFTETGEFIKATGEAAGNMIESGASGKLGVDFNVKHNIGGRAAYSFYGLAGFDLNLGSVETFEFGFQSKGNLQTMEFESELTGDFMSKAGAAGNDVTFGFTLTGFLFGENGIQRSITTSEIGSGSQYENRTTTVKGMPLGDVSIGQDSGELNVRRPIRQLNLNVGFISTFDIDFEIYTDGSTITKQ